MKRTGFQDKGIRIAFPLAVYANVCVYVWVMKRLIYFSKMLRLCMFQRLQLGTVVSSTTRTWYSCVSAGTSEFRIWSQEN